VEWRFDQLPELLRGSRWIMDLQAAFCRLFFEVMAKGAAKCLGAILIEDFSQLRMAWCFGGHRPVKSNPFRRRDQGYEIHADFL